MELARTYEEIGSNEISLKAIELGIKKVLELFLTYTINSFDFLDLMQKSSVNKFQSKK